MNNKETLQSYNNKLIQNNEDLQTVIDMINNLPEAGEGEGGEDLTEELTDYDTKLTVQEDRLLVIAETLKNKAAGANINIFVQEDEPEKKEGLWIKTSQTKPNDISINKLGLTLEWAWEKWTTPVQTAYNRVVKYKNYLYSFCGRNASNSPLDVAFMFNLKTNTAETITPYPTPTIGPAIGIVDDKIYLFGGAIDGGKTAKSYMYDIETDTYTPIKDLPDTIQQSGFVTVGTDIYIIGGSGASGYSTKTYKYDTLTDTYTTLANIPVGMGTHACVHKDGFIYTFGGLRSGGYNQTSYKYDIANNTYTTIKSFPVNRGHYAAGVIGDDIYIFGGYYGGGTYIYDVYKYDTTTDTYTKMPNMSNTWFNGGYTSDGNIMYLVNGEHLGESTDLNIVSKYGYINKKEFANDTIVISTDEDLYNANILNNITTFFDNIVLYNAAENVYQTNLPAYYGDGEKWISLRGEE